jgi:hypothetical protein
VSNVLDSALLTRRQVFSPSSYGEEAIWHFAHPAVGDAHVTDGRFDVREFDGGCRKCKPERQKKLLITYRTRPSERREKKKKENTERKIKANEKA